MNWQLITSAPKDGTRVLVYHKYDGIVSAFWEHDSVYGNQWSHGDCDKYGYYAAIINPSHWMPLPPPPAD